MQASAFDKIIQQIARANHTSSTELRAQMQLAMDAALQDPDPAVQAMWASIPSREEKPTLEEFMDYLVEKQLVKF